jgi:hypothetical protein
MAVRPCTEAMGVFILNLISDINLPWYKGAIIYRGNGEMETKPKQSFLLIAGQWDIQTTGRATSGEFQDQGDNIKDEYY